MCSVCCVMKLKYASEFDLSSVTGVSAGLTNISGLAVAAFNLFRSKDSFTVTVWFVTRWLVNSYVVDMSTDHEMTWWWRNCLSVSFVHVFPRNFNFETVNDIVKKIDNNFPWSVLLSTLEMTSKCSNLFSETTRLRLVVPLLNLYLSFPWSITVQTMQNRCRCFNATISKQYFFPFVGKHEIWRFKFFR